MTNRILIVDDDDLVRLTLEHVLTAAGYQIASATNGKQGLSVFKTFDPHLIMTDMMMPLMNGIEMMVAIKKRQPNLKVIAMSGGASSGRDDLLRRAQEQGADFIISKPFEIERVLSLVAHSLSAGPGAKAAPAISIDDAKDPFVKIGVTCWRSLSERRRFPARRDMTLKRMAAFLPYAVIAGVIGHGADFEYQYVGEAQRRAFKTYFKGMRVTQIEAAAPELGSLLRGAYEQVRSTGTPSLARGRTEYEPAGSHLSYHETAFLPLGATETSVDHLLMIGVQVPMPFWNIPSDTLAVLAEKPSKPRTAA